MATNQPTNLIKKKTSLEGDKQMNTNRQSAVVQEGKVKITPSNLIRWAGLSAIGSGIIFVVMGIIHPPAFLLSVTTPSWVIVHALSIAMSFFGLLGITGIYARQVKETGWLGLVGFVLFSLWLVLVMGFTFVEALILPLLATETPTFVAGFLGMFTGYASEVSLGALPAVWTVIGLLYILGGLLFGIATFRAGILSPWAAGVFGLGAMLAPAFGLLPHELEPMAAIPVGIGLAWLGYSLWSERRAQAAQPLPGKSNPHLRHVGAK